MNEPSQHPRRVQLMRQTDRMGTPLVQVLEDWTDEREAIGPVAMAPPDVVAEDLYSTEQLVFQFDAEPFSGTTGILALELRATPTQGSLRAPSVFDRSSVRETMIRNKGTQVELELKTTSATPLLYRLGYSRRLGTRTACVIDPEDPNEFSELTRFHVTYLDEHFRPLDRVSSIEEIVSIILSERNLEEIRSIDICERLLDQLDEAFVNDDEFLVWNADKVQADSATSIATAFAQHNQFEPLSVLLRSSNEHQLAGKRIRPVIEYPVTMVEGDGRRRCVRIGISNR